MATPYLQIRLSEVSSTQDRALEELVDLPVLVTAASQTAGRGRTGVAWMNAPRALAASLAVEVGEGESRPLSLMAGVAISRILDRTSLKWPNDILVKDEKVGGILVETSGRRVAIGLGLNLWWPNPPAEIAGLYEDDPGEGSHQRVGALWGAEMFGLLAADGWPVQEYRERCSTLGRAITWEPHGSGTALDIATDGGLVVESDGRSQVIRSGTVRHVRT